MSISSMCATISKITSVYVCERAQGNNWKQLRAVEQWDFLNSTHMLAMLVFTEGDWGLLNFTLKEKDELCLGLNLCPLKNVCLIETIIISVEFTNLNIKYILFRIPRDDISKRCHLWDDISSLFQIKQLFLTEKRAYFCLRRWHKRRSG